jgi:dihydroorotate dehydrogenase electron transfer subunit
VVRRVVIKKKSWYTKDTFNLEVVLPGINPQPGQFLQIRTNTARDPFLNRPISIASYKNDRLLLIIRVVGRGTELLSKKKAGEEIEVLGPFGKELKLRNQKSLLIAGGIGVAPLLFVAQKLRAKKIAFDFIHGVQGNQDFIERPYIAKIAGRAIFVSERGKEKMTALEALKRVDIRSYGLVYACGPKAMLINLQKLHLLIPVYAFCEDFLGCGCGLCLGCAIMYRGEYKRICADGPVFELKDIDFNP